MRHSGEFRYIMCEKRDLRSCSRNVDLRKLHPLSLQFVLFFSHSFYFVDAKKSNFDATSQSNLPEGVSQFCSSFEWNRSDPIFLLQERMNKVRKKE